MGMRILVNGHEVVVPVAVEQEGPEAISRFLERESKKFQRPKTMKKTIPSGDGEGADE